MNYLIQSIMTEEIITSSILILAVIFIRILLGDHISQRLKYALWLLVLIKLLVPVPSINSNTSVMNYIEPVPQHIEKIQSTEIHTAHLETTVSTPSQGPTIDFSFIKHLGVWIIGVCLLISNGLFYRRLKNDRKLYSIEKLKIYESSVISSPCLFGRAIYITKDSFRNYKYIIAHEMAHYKHLDFIWTLLRCLCIALYWYNPFVWAAAILSKRDSELACDETVILQLGERERKNYGKALLDTISDNHRFWLYSTHATGGNKEMKKRITMITKKTNKSILATFLVLVCLATATACTMTTNKKSPDKNSTKTTDPLTVVQEIMPDTIKKKLQNDGQIYEDKENSMISISDVKGNPDEGNPSLQFDIYYSGDMITGFRCSIDSFLNSQKGSAIDDKEAKEQIETFAKILLNKEVTVTKANKPASDTITGYYTDQEGDTYTVNMQHGFVEDYTHSEEKQGISDNEKNQLVQNIAAAMPKEVVDEVQNNGYFYTTDSSSDISVANDKKADPTLRLDFTFEKGTLTSYVSKEYGFVDSLTIKDKKAPKDIVKNFAKTFLNKEVTLKSVANASHYTGGTYKTFEDQDHARYVVQKDKNMVVNYSQAD